MELGNAEDDLLAAYLTPFAALAGVVSAKFCRFLHTDQPVTRRRASNALYAE
jgi:hypothetical protein